MKISMDLYGVLKRFEEKQALHMIRSAGFDCVDYSFYWLGNRHEVMLGEDYLRHAADTRRFLDEIGLSCNQAHAPFDFDPACDTMDMSNVHFRDTVRSMEAAAILGASCIVVHGLKATADKSVLELNTEFYKNLEPYARACGIKIAVENLFGNPYDEVRQMYLGNRFETPEKMLELLAYLRSDTFVCCVDVGHATVTGIAPEVYIQGLNRHVLKALHIQDNHLRADDHLLPYTGEISWERVARSLRDIGYDGDLTFEIFKFLDRFPAAVVPDVLRLAHSVGKHIESLIGMA